MGKKKYNFINLEVARRGRTLSLTGLTFSRGKSEGGGGEPDHLNPPGLESLTAGFETLENPDQRKGGTAPR